MWVVRPLGLVLPGLLAACAEPEPCAERDSCLPADEEMGTETGFRPDTAHETGETADLPHSGETAETGDTSAPPCDRSGVLIYGPTDMAGATLLEDAGYTVTVWDADAWGAATPEDFARFALIVVGEQSCDGPDTMGELDALVATGHIWGPVVDGRVLIAGLDLQCHITDFEHTGGGDETVPPLLWDNAVSWLSEVCATSAMFATAWGRRGGDHLDVFGDITEIGRRGDTVEILEPDHALFAGVASGGLDGWGSTYHSVYPAWPDSFTVLASSVEGDPVILARGELAEEATSP